MTHIIVNADGAVVGRMAAWVAKQALLGHTIDVVNSETAIFTKKHDVIVHKYHERTHNTTPFKGPFISRLPDRFVRRIIRGMLPHHTARGKTAWKNIMCHLGVPEEFEGKDMTVVERARSHTGTRKTRVLDVCRALGAHI